MDNVRTFVEEQTRQTLAQSDLVLQGDALLSRLPGWDSIKMLSLLVSIEKKFKVTFHAREVTNLKTFNDLLQLTNAKISK